MRKIFILFIITLLSSCADKKFAEDYNKNIQETNKFAELDNAVSSIASDPLANAPTCVQASVNVKNIPLTTLATLLSRLYKANINASMFNQDKEFSLSLKLTNVCLSDVLSELTTAYNIGYIQTTNGYNIYPPHVRSRIFAVNYHNFYRSGSSALSINSSQLSSSGNNSSTTGGGDNFSKIESKSTDVFWDNIEKTLNVIILDDKINNGSQKEDTASSQIAVYRESGIIIVRALPRALQNIEAFLKSVNKNSLQQVVIEAKILDVQLDEEFSQGIQWELLKKKLYMTSFNNTAQSIPAISDVFKSTRVPLDNSDLVTTVMSGRFGNHTDFDAVLQALSTQGKISVLSSPRLSALNNQRALMKYGDERYFVTNVSNMQFANANSPNNSNNTQSSIDLTPFFSGVALDTTARIVNDKEVVLHIHPIITTVKEEGKKIQVDGKESNIPVARVQTREADTVVKAGSGDIIIIGGLVLNSVGLKTAKPAVPNGFLQKLLAPFTAKHNVSSKNELIILLRPTIINSTHENVDQHLEKYLLNEKLE